MIDPVRSGEDDYLFRPRVLGIWTVGLSRAQGTRVDDMTGLGEKSRRPIIDFSSSGV